MSKEDIEKISLWVLIIFFSFVALILFAPYIGYIVIVLGITIPAYLLYKKNKNDEKSLNMNINLFQQSKKIYIK